MSGHLELCYWPMFRTEDGASYIDRSERGEREPDFYDIQVLRYTPSGAVAVIEEHEDLSVEDANRIFDELEAKYPSAELHAYE